MSDSTITVDPPFITPVTEAVLLALKASERRHSGRTLQDHLVGTAEILYNWEQPQVLIDSGLFHSIYSTPSYTQKSATYSSRSELRLLLGNEVEQLVYLLSMIDSGAVQRALAHPDNQDTDLVEVKPVSRGTEADKPLPGSIILPRSVVDQLAVILIANLLEQAKERSGEPSPSLWDAQELAKHLSPAQWPEPQVRRFLCAATTPQEELQLLDSYREALSKSFGDPQGAEGLFVQNAVSFPLLGELHVWSAWLALKLGRPNECIERAQEAIRVFDISGVAWDKRLPLIEWKRVATQLARGLNDEEVRLRSIIDSDIRSRWNEVPPPRFFEYIRRIGQTSFSRRNSWYPGLTSRPLHDSRQFAIATLLTEHFAEIRAEALAMNCKEFHAEAEAIERTGRWEVLMLFEVGRKNVANCNQLPTLTRLLEISTDVRTTAGLIYLSRMKAGTRVAAHRGGNNLRLRLHLGISIPQGDCSLRVHDQILHWTEGECIVFDDFFEHEVRNDTDEDRLVLVVDLWHPDLSEIERQCLDSINRQIISQGNGRNRYLELNERQKQREANNS